MPINLIALAYVLVPVGCSFIYLRLICQNKEQLFKWTRLWVILLGVIFVIPSYWGIIVCTLIFSFTLKSQDINRIVYFFLLLPIMNSDIFFSIEGVPGINYLLIINFPLLLSAVILTPLFFGKKESEGDDEKQRLINSPIDGFILLFFVLNAALLLQREPTLTSSLRQILILAISKLIPYFAISRNVKTLDDFILCYKAIFVALFFVAVIGFMEAALNWPIYNVIPKYYGNKVIISPLFYQSLYRSGFIRIVSSIGESIPLGYAMMVGIGVTNLFRYYRKDKNLANIISYAILGGAAYLTGSRGAWLGVMILMLLNMLFSVKTKIVRSLLVLGLLLSPLIIAVSDITLTGFDEYGTFDYRLELIQNSLDAVRQNLLFGSDDFWQNSSLEASRQGQGIIDITNTYLLFALSNGVVGLALFCLTFLALCLTLYRRIKLINDESAYVIKGVGITILTILVGTMVVIGTVSSVGHIPFYYWAMIGLGSAYVHMTRPDKISELKDGLSDEDADDIEQYDKYGLPVNPHD